jgi:hypothetical protein
MIRLLLSFVIVAPLTIVGCKSETRETTAIDKGDDISISGTIQLPVDGGFRSLPVSFSITRKGWEDQRKESTTKSGADADAIGNAVAKAILPIMTAGSGGIPWSGLLAGVGGAVTAATTGYLALAKRGQIKSSAKPS